MSNLLLLLLLSSSILLGCSSGLDASDINLEEQESDASDIGQEEREQEILSKIQSGIFIDDVTFDDISKTYTVVSDHHEKALEKVKQGEELITRNGKEITWEYYINYFISTYFNPDESGSYGISGYLGEGYTLTKINTNGDTIFIAKDGELVYDIINGYVN